jgi:hypothetical protein
VVLAAAIALAACVPTGNAPPYDAGTTATAAPSFKPSINVMTAPFEDNFDRPDAGEGTWPAFEAGAPHAAEGGAGEAGAARDAGRATPSSSEAGAGEAEGGLLSPNLLSTLLRDGGLADAAAGPPSNLGPNWMQAKTSAWRVENGRLCGQGARNHPVWLNKVLPVNARVEFDAVSLSEDGDLKCEVWGDGQSYATSTSYTNATSYIAVLGGWKNTTHVLARINEHGADRKEIKVDKDSDDPRQRAVQKGQVYHFKVERTDGRTVRWFVDNLEYLKWEDASPLAGQGHDHFGFNEWEVKVCFDNVKVTPL